MGQGVDYPELEELPHFKRRDEQYQELLKLALSKRRKAYSMSQKVGYLVGSLVKASINRKLANALIRLAPAELDMVEISFEELPLCSYDCDRDFHPSRGRSKLQLRQSMRSYS